MKKIFLLIVMMVIAFSVTKAQTITRIDSIQYISPSDLATGNDLSYKSGDTVWIVGKCIFEPCYYAQSGSAGYPSRLASILIDTAAGSAAFKGLQVMLDPAAIGLGTGSGGAAAANDVVSLNNTVGYVNNFSLNTIVKCKGIVSNFNGNTQLILLPVAAIPLGVSASQSAIVTTIDSLMHYNSGTSTQDIQYTTGERYEGQYVQINFPTVTNVSTTTANRYRWEIKDAAGNQIVIQDNFSGNFTNTIYDQFCNNNNGTSYTPTIFPPTPNNVTNGTVLTYVRGVILQNFNTTTGLKYYSLAPLQLSDIGNPTYAPPVVSAVSINPGNPTPTQTVDVYANAVDDSSVVSVECFYAFGLSNSTFTSVNMSLQTGATYKGTIPATVTDSTYVKYYIKATDNFGHISYYPDNQASNSYYLSIASGVYSIRTIQGRMFSNGKSIYTNDSLSNISVDGIVTSTTQNDDLGMITIQDGTSPFSGIVLDGASAANLHRGEKIHITSAKVNEKFNITTLSNPVFTITSVNNTLPLPINVVNIDSLIANKHSYAEPFESMLIGYNNVAVIDTNPDFGAGKNFGEFSIHTSPSATTGLRCDDFSNNILIGFNIDSLLKQQALCYVNGILTFAFGNWKMYPRNLSDICSFNTAYNKLITSFAITGNTGFVNQSANTILVTMPAGTNPTALVPNFTFVGQSVSPATNIAQDFTNPITYTVTASDNTTRAYVVTVAIAAGIDEINGGKLSVYPNPVKDKLLVNNYQLSVNTIEVTNLLGQQQNVLVEKLNTENYQLNTTNLLSGIYFIKATDTKGNTRNAKFIKE